MKETRAKYFVLLDTNVWVYSTDMLQDPIGQALLYTLRHTGGKIAMPSVIRQEIEKHALSRCIEATTQMAGSIRILERLCNFGGYFDPPSEDDIRKAVKARIEMLSPLLIHVEWTLEDAQSALQRVMDEAPPNTKKNQQYKDSLIWESIPTLLRDAPVHFVSEDKSFFESRQPEKGLSKNLESEITKFANKFKIHIALSDCLSELTVDRPDLQLREYVAPLMAAVAPLIRKACAESRISIGNIQNSASDLQAFTVNDQGAIAIKFHLVYPAERFESEGHPLVTGTLHVFGASLGSKESKTVGKTQIHHVDFCSPQIGEGSVWLRVANEMGEDGPLPVDNPAQWIVEPIPDKSKSRIQ
jgi:hypothetical protein